MGVSPLAHILYYKISSLYRSELHGICSDKPGLVGGQAVIKDELCARNRVCIQNECLSQ